MKLEFSELKNTPAWILLILIGGICLLFGAAQQITLVGNSIQFSRPYNLVVLGVGGILILVGVLEQRRPKNHLATPMLSAKEVIINSIEIDSRGEYPHIRIMGKITPAAEGVRIWILREDLSRSPGYYHVGVRPALTDKKGEWRQFTSLWKGSFQIHAVAASPDAEMLFSYYREAFEHARNVYRQKTDMAAVSFPDWPYLKSIPPGCASDHKLLVL
jgi:hypothetical protein